MSRFDLYLVIGPESSGTRMVTKWLTEAGVTGHPYHLQEFDFNPNFGESPVVLRKSYPHNEEWPSLGKMIEVMGEQRDDVETVITLVTFRNWYCSAYSQIERGHSESMEEAFSKLKKAQLMIYSQLHNNKQDFELLSYDAMTSIPELGHRRLEEITGLERPERFEFREENEKYFIENRSP